MSRKVQILQWIKAINTAPELHKKDKAVRVALAVAGYANPDGTKAYPGRLRLAADLGVHPNTIDSALRLLRDTGWLVRVARGSTGARKNMADEYKLAFPARGAAAEETVSTRLQNDHLRYDQSQYPGDQSQFPGDQSQNPEDHSQPRVLPTYPYSPTPVSSTHRHLSEAEASGPPAGDDDDRWFEEVFAWVEDQVQGFDGFEESTATNMLYGGSNPKTVVNTLRKRR